MANVLLIEPDRLLARTYGAYLRYADHTVRWAPTAQAAVQACDENKPDVVLLELQLVEHSGFGFLYEFRSYADWHMVPVVVLSGVPAEQFEQSSQLLRERLGVRAYYYKPQMSLKAVVAAVESALAPV